MKKFNKTLMILSIAASLMACTNTSKGEMIRVDFNTIKGRFMTIEEKYQKIFTDYSVGFDDAQFTTVSTVENYEYIGDVETSKTIYTYKVISDFRKFYNEFDVIIKNYTNGFMKSESFNKVAEFYNEEKGIVCVQQNNKETPRWIIKATNAEIENNCTSIGVTKEEYLTNYFENTCLSSPYAMGYTNIIREISNSDFNEFASYVTQYIPIDIEEDKYFFEINEKDTKISVSTERENVGEKNDNAPFGKGFIGLELTMNDYLLGGFKYSAYIDGVYYVDADLPPIENYRRGMTSTVEITKNATIESYDLSKIPMYTY